MREQEEDLFEEGNLEEEEELIEGEKKSKLKIYLPLILLGGLFTFLGGYYYYIQLVEDTNGSTPLTSIPTPKDSTIVGAEHVDQVSLAEAQLSKQADEAGFKEEKVKAEDVTRLNFSVKDNKSRAVASPKPEVNNNPIDNNNKKAIRIENYKPDRKTLKVIRSSRPMVTKSSNVNPQLKTVAGSEDPFNIVIGQKSKKTSNTESTKETNTATKDYNEYVKQYSSNTQDEEPVPATIYGRQRILPGQTVAIKTQKNMTIKGQLIKSGSLIYGLPTIDNGRISIKINNIRNGNLLVKTSISVLGEDMNDGVQYFMKGTTDYSNTKGQIVDVATSSLGTIGSIIGGVGRNNTKSRETEYWLQENKKVYLSIN